MADRTSDIGRIFDLLGPGPSNTLPDRYLSAERLLFAPRDDESVFLRTVLLEAIERGDALCHGDVLLGQATEFLDDLDLRRVARHFAETEKRLNQWDNMPVSLALQAPNAFPVKVLRELNDYRLWFESTNPLVDQVSWHVCFDDLPPGARYRPTEPLHPTWNLPSSGEVIVVGGKSSARCLVCGHPRVHVATLETVPDGLGISLAPITIETCANCLGQAFFSHGRDGFPTQISPLPPPFLDHFDTYPIRSRARLAPTPQRWARQSWGSRQNLFHFGGLPSWVQYSEIPNAPGSNRPMKFLAQFDSGLDAGDGSTFLWGSGGLLYVFWDDDTRTSCTFAQWT